VDDPEAEREKKRQEQSIIFGEAEETHLYNEITISNDMSAPFPDPSGKDFSALSPLETMTA
jgi:hypothetical protein